jgi:hypothetical protein
MERESGGAANFDLTQEDVQASRGQTGDRQETQAYRDLGSGQDAQTYRDFGGGTRDSGMSTRDRQADLRTNQLNRDYAARHNGYDRYNNNSSRRAVLTVAVDGAASAKEFEKRAKEHQHFFYPHFFELWPLVIDCECIGVGTGG